MLSNLVCFDSNTHRTRTHVNTKVYTKSNRFYSPFFIVNYQEERYLKKEDIIKFKIANFCLLALTINIWLTFVQH